MKLAVGQTYKMFFSANNPNNKERIEIRAIVDGEWIVWSFKTKHDREFRYEMEHLLWFELLAEHEVLTVV